MSRHPNRRLLPYRVRYSGHEAAFTDDQQAMELARLMSTKHQCTVDIEKTHGPLRGIVFRFKNGEQIDTTL